MCDWKQSKRILLFLPIIYFVGVFESPLSANLTSRNCDGGIFSATRCLCVNLLAHDRPHGLRDSQVSVSYRCVARDARVRFGWGQSMSIGISFGRSGGSKDLMNELEASSRPS